MNTSNSDLCMPQCPPSPWSAAAPMTPVSEIDDCMSIVSMAEVEQDGHEPDLTVVADVKQDVVQTGLDTMPATNQDLSDSDLSTMTEVERDASKPDLTTIILHPSGDIYVSSLTSPSTQFLCSSAFLSQTSPILSSLVLSSPTPLLTLDAPLPSLTHLLRMIHHRPCPSTPPDPDPESIYQLAQLCDRYACANIFSPNVRYWFRTVPRSWTFRDTTFMLAAAALFHLPTAFRDLSRALAWRYGEPLSQIGVENDCIHPKAIYYMDLQRREARVKIRQIFSPHRPVAFSCGCLPDADGTGLKAAYRSLLDDPVDVAVGNVRSYLKASVWGSGGCRTHSKGKPRSCNWESTPVYARLEFVEKGVVGLCLECYLEGAKEMGSCKGEH